MIPDHLVEAINTIRFVFFEARELLAASPSFRSLSEASSDVAATLKDLDAVAANPRLRDPCDGRLTCAFIGSSGHGKTTILDEMFPRLSERGWLVTDVTDTTSQALRISHAAPGDPTLDEVLVRSWNATEIKALMRHPEVAEQNERDGIRVTYLPDGVEVDGSEAAFPPKDAATFRFPTRLALHPFAADYAVPADRRGDRAFIRALTVKEQSGVIASGPVLEVGGRAYDALQLRALVKDVQLRDPYERLAALSGRPVEDVAALTFLDTPGLAVNGSVKDEVLRHFLEQKSNHVALQLWKDDELDIVVHLALCGRQSDFAVLWKAIEREIGQAEMDEISDRLVLAVNGMNVYFTNRDVRAKYEDPETARREGDHFATTVEDNILQKMSPRGRVRPAGICFLDSRSIVETTTAGSYERAYAQWRPLMEGWAEPGGIGSETLARLGLTEAFRENAAALADPEDRGQGHLLRQILALAEARGPAILLRKFLLKSGLLRGIGDLRALLATYYDEAGAMNRAAVRDALRGCLGFLDASDPVALEHFAVAEIDPMVERIVPEQVGQLAGAVDGPNGAPGGAGPAARESGWVAESFERCRLELREILLAHATAPSDVQAEFARYYEARTQEWARTWGYETAALTPPERGYGTSADLVTHCLRLHAREIVHQLLVADDGHDHGYEQPAEDKARIADVFRMLDEGRTLAEDALGEHGVTR